MEEDPFSCWASTDFKNVQAADPRELPGRRMIGKKLIVNRVSLDSVLGVLEAEISTGSFKITVPYIILSAVVAPFSCHFGEFPIAEPHVSHFID